VTAERQRRLGRQAGRRLASKGRAAVHATARQLVKGGLPHRFRWPVLQMRRVCARWMALRPGLPCARRYLAASQHQTALRSPQYANCTCMPTVCSRCRWSKVQLMEVTCCCVGAMGDMPKCCSDRPTFMSEATFAVSVVAGPCRKGS